MEELKIDIFSKTKKHYQFIFKIKNRIITFNKENRLKFEKSPEDVKMMLRQQLSRFANGENLPPIYNLKLQVVK